MWLVLNMGESRTSRFSLCESTLHDRSNLYVGQYRSPIRPRSKIFPWTWVRDCDNSWLQRLPDVIPREQRMLPAYLDKSKKYGIQA